MSPTDSSSDDLSVYSSFDCESHARELSESLSRYTRRHGVQLPAGSHVRPHGAQARSQDLRAELVALSLTTVPVGFLIDRFKAIDKECCSLGFPISEIDLVVIFCSKFFGHPVFDDLVESLIHQPSTMSWRSLESVRSWSSSMFRPLSSQQLLSLHYCRRDSAHRFVPMVPVMQRLYSPS